MSSYYDTKDSLEGIMFKKFVVGAVAVVAVITLAACGKSADQKNYADEAFYTSMAKGLHNRWKLSDKQDKSGKSYTAENYRNLYDAELKQVRKYPSKDFKSKKLHKLAKDYVDSLNGQKKELANFDDNSAQSIATWDKALIRRESAIIAINAYKKIPFDSKKDKKRVKTLASERAKNQDFVDTFEAMDKKVKSSKIVLADGDSGYKTYHVLLDNTTKHSFSYFNIDVKLVDKNGVTVDTQEATTENWDAGSKVQFEFGTDKDFATYKLTIGDYDYTSQN
jgi:hypothetical protein